MIRTDAVAEEISSSVGDGAFYGIGYDFAVGHDILLHYKTDAGKGECRCHSYSHGFVIVSAFGKGTDIECQGIVFLPSRQWSVRIGVVYGIGGA